MKIHGTALLAMVRKDLLRHLRAPLGPGLLLAFPILFSGILALSQGGELQVPRVQLLIEDQDGGIVSGLVRSAFTSERAAKYFSVEVIERGGLKRIENGEASALLRIPPEFSQRILDQEPVTLELVRNPAQGILPEIAEQVTQILVEVLDAGVHVLEGPLNLIQPYLDGDSEEVPDLAVAGIAVEVNQLMKRADRFLFPPVIELDTWTREDMAQERRPISDSRGGSIFLFILPGVAVFSLFSIADLMMRDLLKEGQRGTLGRQLASPIRPLEAILGKAVVTFIVGAISLLVLTVFAAFVAERGINLLAYCTLAAALLLASTGTASFIYGFARSESQGATISSVVYLVMAFGGGAFVPLGSLPASVQAVAPFSPFYWATEGFRLLQRSGVQMGELRLHILVLLLIGSATLLAGAWLLKRKVLRGDMA